MEQCSAIRWRSFSLTKGFLTRPPNKKLLVMNCLFFTVDYCALHIT